MRRIAIPILIAAAAVSPAAASGLPTETVGLGLAVRAVQGAGASAAATVNVLTLSDQRGIDNRVTATTDASGRLTLTAPEGLGDPDGSGSHCSLDNVKPTEATAQEVSCEPGYIGAIVGDLGGGADSFESDPELAVMIGATIDGQPRPLGGGTGRDRLIGGALGDLLNGAGGPDKLSGGGGSDQLQGGAGADKLNGGPAQDVCRGAGGTDTARACETVRSIP